MKHTAILAGIIGIVVSLVAQLYAINDDNYHFGNIWFIGVLSGIIGIIGANLININNKKAIILVTLSLFFGFMGIGSLYLISAGLQLITIAYLLIKLREIKGDFDDVKYFV